MTKDEIKRNAPSGAIGYVSKFGHNWYIKKHRGVVCVYYRHEWVANHAAHLNINVSEMVKL